MPEDLAMFDKAMTWEAIHNADYLIPLSQTLCNGIVLDSAKVDVTANP